MLVTLVLASTFAAIFGTASATTTTYTLSGFVDQPGGPLAPPVPAGVTVDLVSRATGQVFTTTVQGSSGQFSFTSSGTGGVLAPGYWAVYVPPAAGVTVLGCKPCAVLPVQQNPTYRYFNTTELTNSAYSTIVTNVSILPYNATLKGTVTQQGNPVEGAGVRLLAPSYAGLVLVNNTTDASGGYSLKVPFGSWVAQATHVSGSGLYTNTTGLVINTRTPLPFDPILRSYAISGRIYSSTTGSYVTVPGNATLFDPTNHYLYTSPTATGGYFAFPSYPADFNFTSGNQTFSVVLSANGFRTGWFEHTVSTPTPYTRLVALTPATSANLGSIATTLDFTGVNVATGNGSLGVTTSAELGNDSVVAALPNATVGQLWAQLGLDFNRSLTFPASDLSAVRAWINASGPFFPAVQAQTTINNTGFTAPTAAQGLSSWSSTCSGYCGLTSSANLSYGWATTYALGGSIPKNASSYTISFRFAHPTVSSLVYDYKIDLPTGYVLSAGTTAPSRTSLVGSGPNGTWTSFTLVSKPSSTSSATARFTAVRAADITAIVNVTSSNFAFSSGNILNKTRGGYTVVLGPNQNATFSAANSKYPVGTNGTSFTWDFGNGHNVTVSTPTTAYSYPATSGANPYAGTLTVTSSGGRTSTTNFYVWVVSSDPVAKISSNATTAQKFVTTGGWNYVVVNWAYTLQFNAGASTVTSPNVKSIASFTLTAKNYKATANYSVAKGAKFDSNWSVPFGLKGGTSKTAPGHGLYVNFATVKLGGDAVSATGWGWIYNLTLTVWTGVGTSNSTVLTILVKDTEAPVPSITLVSAATGKTITGGNIVEGANHFARVRLNGSSSSDYGNGSVVKYTWNVTNKGNSSFTPIAYQNTTAIPNPVVKLAPQTGPYTIRLNVVDKNGVNASTTVSLQVAYNTTLRPTLSATNLTGETSLNAGTTYTFWVNVNVGGGARAVAKNLTVAFYLMSPSGTGSKTYIGGTPGSVVFYGYSNNTSNATVNSTVLATGKIPTLKQGLTVRAQITWNPSTSGSFVLYAAAYATNQIGNGSTNVASVPITVHPNPTTQLLEYVGIGVGVVAVILGLVWYFRRRSRRPPAPKGTPSSRSGLERGARRDEDDES